MNYLQLRNEVREAINQLENAKMSIPEELKCGIIDEIGAVGKGKMIDSKILKLKKEAVNKIHVTKNGTPKKISPFGTKGLYRTIVNKNEPPIIGISEDVVYEKLFEYYGLTLSSTKIKDIFKEALKERTITENLREDTVERYEYDYKRFFVTYSNSFPKMDVRDVTSKDLKAYTQKMVNELRPTLSAFKAYKGVLNLIFEYAYRNGLINRNPVEEIKNSTYNKSMAPTKTKPEEKIFSPDEIELIKATVIKRFSRRRYNDYFINGYAILFAIETGVRVGELCSLKWSDVKGNQIWIHSQQLHTRGKGWGYCSYTKNERMLPPEQRKGRCFPITKKIRAILDELKAKQEKLGISSEYIFCNTDGDWIKASAYHSCLRTLCKGLFGKNCEVTNNHAFRMSLNSNVFIPKGLPVTERARLLGHSVETNENRYSFAGKNNIDEIRELLDA